MTNLSRGAIAQMKTGSKPDVPIVQILNIKAVITAGAANNAPTRYRILLMDGADYISAMSATQLNEQITNKSIIDFSVVRLTNYMIQDVAGQKMCVVLGMDVLEQLTAQIPGLNVQTEGYSTPGGGAPVPVYNNTPQAPQSGAYGQQQQQYAPPAAPVNNGYGSYGAPQQQQQQAQRPPVAPVSNPYNSSSYAQGGATNNRAVMRDDSSQSIVPISAINPYSSRWTIKARITTKSDLKRWSNAKGEGTLFSIDLLDNAGGEIRATFFKDSCDKFFPVLEEGKVYTFSGGVLKMVQNKQFSNIKNQYELTFNANSDIQPANDDANIKTQSYNFVKIEKIADMNVADTIDIIGIVRVAGECQEIQSKAGKALQKRDLTIVDDSFAEIRLTLWGDKAQATYEWHSAPIVAIKGCKIGDYMGRTLSTSNGSSITLNPQSPEGHALNSFRSQFADGMIPVRASMSSGGGGPGGGVEFDLEKRKTIQSIKDENMGTKEKADFVVIKGTVSYVKHDNDPWYTACPSTGCNKKVLEGMGGQWSCEKCNMQFDQCQRRYIATMTLADHSGNNWFSMFNESAEKLLGKTAEELYQYKTEGNEAAFDGVFSDALFKTFVCKIRVKQEMVNDEQRVKCNVISMTSLDLVAESKQMLDAISKYN